MSDGHPAQSTAGKPLTWLRWLRIAVLVCAGVAAGADAPKSVVLPLLAVGITAAICEVVLEPRSSGASAVRGENR